MAEHYGIIQSIIKLGYNAYQVTFRIHKIGGEEDVRSAGSSESPYEVLVYRADIVIENGRSILFPDRELVKCLEACHDSSNERLSGVGWESQRNVGKIADRICRQMSALLLERQTTGPAWARRAG